MRSRTLAVVGITAAALGTATVFAGTASAHNTGTSFNYADGHSDVHHWTDSKFYNDTAHNVTMTSPDLTWLAQHAWSQQ